MTRSISSWTKENFDDVVLFAKSRAWAVFLKEHRQQSFSSRSGIAEAAAAAAAVFAAAVDGDV